MTAYTALARPDKLHNVRNEASAAGSERAAQPPAVDVEVEAMQSPAMEPLTELPAQSKAMV